MMGLITGCNFYKTLVEGLNVNLRATQSYILQFVRGATCILYKLEWNVYTSTQL